MMSELLVAYTQRQICAIELEKVRPNRFIDEEGKLEAYDELGGVPRVEAYQLLFVQFFPHISCYLVTAISEV